MHSGELAVAVLAGVGGYTTLYPTTYALADGTC